MDTIIMMRKYHHVDCKYVHSSYGLQTLQQTYKAYRPSLLRFHLQCLFEIILHFREHFTTDFERHSAFLYRFILHIVLYVSTIIVLMFHHFLAPSNLFFQFLIMVVEYCLLHTSILDILMQNVWNVQLCAYIRYFPRLSWPFVSNLLLKIFSAQSFGILSFYPSKQ